MINLSFTKPSIADKVMSLCLGLKQKGFIDMEIEVATLFSEINEAVERRRPVGQIGGENMELGEHILVMREAHRAILYNILIKPYEEFLTKSKAYTSIN